MRAWLQHPKRIQRHCSGADLSRRYTRILFGRLRARDTASWDGGWADQFLKIQMCHILQVSPNRCRAVAIQLSSTLDGRIGQTNMTSQCTAPRGVLIGTSAGDISTTHVATPSRAVFQCLSVAVKSCLQTPDVRRQRGNATMHKVRHDVRIAVRRRVTSSAQK